MSRQDQIHPGQRSLRGRGAVRGAGLFRRLSDHAVDGDRRAFVQTAAAIGGKFIQMEDEIASMCAIIGASLTGHKVLTATSGPGFFAQAGSPGLRGDGRDSLRDRQRAARGAVHGGAHPREPGGRDAGALGHARGPQHRGADGVEPPGRVRHDGGGLQHRRDLPHAGGAVVRRGGGSHARASGDSRGG
jgi:hypothetical protein